MAPRRWLLFLLSLGSLVILAYAGVLLAFSVPVTEEMQAASRLPGAAEPSVGTRALVVPLTDAAAVPTLAQNATVSGPYAGALLVVADDDPSFPASATNASVVRALAYVVPGPEGVYQPAQLNLSGVPAVDASGNATTVNLTLDVAPLAQGAAGFVVRADASGETFFVPRERVLGEVGHFEPGSQLVILLAMGAFGFVMPLVTLMLTHRASGRPGLGEVACAECRGPMPASSDFCTRCGAWKKGRGPDA